MCELDFDERATVWDERLIGHARKVHRCDTCEGPIAPGDSYVAHFSVFEGYSNYEKQCLRCRTIADAFTREHRSSITPSALLEYLDQCLDEDRWADDSDEDTDEDERPRNRLPSRLSDAGLRWKYAIVEIRARNAEATP